MAEWEVERTSGKCTVSGRPLSEGEEFYAVLFDRNGKLERIDYALESWNGPPEGAYCFWKSRVPVKEKKRQVWVDNDILANLFVRLADEEDEGKIQFRFVLALLLMRKRLLKYEQTLRDGDREHWQMRFLGELANQAGGAVHLVRNPQLSDEQIKTVSEQLSAILHGDVREDIIAHATASAEGNPQELADEASSTQEADTAKEADANPQN